MTEQRTQVAQASPCASPSAVVLGVGTAIVALHDWLGLGGAWLDSAAEGWLYDAVVVAAGLTCLVRAHERRPRAARLDR